jgi:hypothetical protein
MAFLDWIDRNKQQPVANKSQEPRAEHAKQWHTPEAALDKANQEPINTLPAAVKTRLDATKTTLDRATWHHDPDGDGAPNRPAGGAANREAMQQNMAGWDRTAPAAQVNEANAEQRFCGPAIRGREQSAESTKAPTYAGSAPASWER